MHQRFAPGAGKHVLVVGDVILDRYVYGETTRVSPEAPVPIVHVGRLEERPGGAANVAANVRSLGVEATLAGVVGEDAAGEALQHLVEAAGVRCRLMRSRDFQRVTKVRVVSQHRQLLCLDYEGPMSTEAGALLEECKGLLPDVHCVVLSDYAKGSLGRVREIIEAAGRAGLMVLVDPKGRDFSRYRGATLLTPNQREFEDVAGRASDD